MTEARATPIHPSRRGLLTGAVALAGLAAAPVAEAAPPALIDLEVIDRDTGAPARLWRHGGRAFVAGRPGARYSLKVTNTSPGRVMAVLSVDGVNILTGETAAFDQRGYVFGPYESYEISGWRKSDTEVAAFHFTGLSRSYAARTGRPADVGVIGVAAFTERAVKSVPAAQAATAPSPARREARPADDEAAVRASRTGRPPPPPSLQMAPQAERLGTGHGAREWSAVTLVSFERATRHPQFVQRIEYDSFENLVASGVIPRPRLWPTPPRPRPFPGGGGYAPDPPDFR